MFYYLKTKDSKKNTPDQDIIELEDFALQEEVSLSLLCLSKPSLFDITFTAQKLP